MAIQKNTYLECASVLAAFVDKYEFSARWYKFVLSAVVNGDAGKYQF